jgi:MoaA/NifB/PqqE/SkfB family radical SAM enzyme
VESADIPKIKNIAFTGGEVFLFYDELKDLISLSKKVGKKSSLATNGFWAVDEEVAYNKMKNLKDRGLNHISISYDRYHGEYVKADNIKNILRASLGLELPVSISVVKLKDESIGSLLDELGSDIYPASIKIGACMPVGEAKKNFSDNSFDRTLKTEYARCTFGGSLSIMPDGKIYPCCSQVIRDTALCIGDFYKLSLAEALNKAKNNVLLYFLRNRPMSFFTKYATNELGERYPDKIVNPCELCGLLFNPDHIQSLHEYIMSRSNEIKRDE